MPPIETTIFPASPIDRIWRAALAELQKAPALGRVKTWQTWTGDDDDFIAIPLNAMPAIRLGQGFGAFRWSDECRHSGPMTIGVELAVPRPNVSELTNMWHAVAKVLAWRPGEDPQSWRQKARALGVVTCTLTVPAAAPRLIAAGQALAGRGQIELSIDVSY